MLGDAGDGFEVVVKMTGLLSLVLYLGSLIFFDSLSSENIPESVPPALDSASPSFMAGMVMVFSVDFVVGVGYTVGMPGYVCCCAEVCCCS